MKNSLQVLKEFLFLPVKWIMWRFPQVKVLPAIVNQVKPYYFSVYFVVVTLTVGAFLCCDVGIFLNINRSVLNRLRPANLDVFVKGTATEKETEEGYRFFKKVAGMMPNDPDAQGIYGYFSYLKGNRGDAIRAYERASLKNPIFFWFSYNRGLLYYQEHDFVNAEKNMREALRMNYMLSILFITQSKHVYLPFLVLQPDGMQKFLFDQYARGRDRAQRVIDICEQARLAGTMPQPEKDNDPAMWPLELY
ncbi:MAG: hypothetical protein HQL22_04455 [Candidatus Omnitrophica bacterium]|nr:hypothetical protein [Candidatus Omnitrophota bacterium]